MQLGGGIGGGHEANATDRDGVLAFELAEPTPVLNEVLRRGWQANRRADRQLAGLIRLATVGRRPAVPWERARLMVERRSIRDVDQDGAMGGLKSLIDALLPPGPPYLTRRGQLTYWACKYPNGLSIVRDDGPNSLIVELTCTRVRSRAEQGTSIRVLRLD